MHVIGTCHNQGMWHFYLGSFCMFSFSNNLFWGQWTIPMFCKKQETLLVKADTCETPSLAGLPKAYPGNLDLGCWSPTSKPLSIGWGEFHVNFGSLCQEFERSDFGSLTFQLCLFLQGFSTAEHPKRDYNLESDSMLLLYSFCLILLVCCWCCSSSCPFFQSWMCQIHQIVLQFLQH